MSDWYPPLGRAIPALALAAVITFSADHSARLGLLCFGAFATVSGVLLSALVWRSRTTPAGRVQLVQGAITLVAGIVGLVLSGGGLPFLVFLVTAWAAVTGMLELWLGIRYRGRDRAARDWIFAGALTALLAVAVLLVPPGLAQAFTGPDGVTRELTAAVVVVGLLGAYAALLGVFLTIGALSLKWSPETGVVAPEPRGARS
ncbi:hypothetical protein PYV02_01200 [Leifsonia sp. H3M29-4]|uniref:hypothetical protein n=1 Tax=Salinibacterium metalliresistens TaxID=3031321 RepID=UPI0023DB67C5|nr:hypothetical protein [Salinibacterium metalliresistens]MDF1477696.1 hypothetical protein [Salinibacterium metalliresistens]